MCKPSIFYNGAEISYKSVVKFLGINVTESLNWHTHINSLGSSLSKIYFIIKTLKDAMSYYMIRLIYYAHFQSRLKYGIIFWWSVKDSLKVFLTQRKVTRLIAGVINECLVEVYFQNLKFLHCLHFTSWKYYVLSKYWKVIWKANSRYMIIIRGRNKLFIQACNTALYQNSVINKAIRLYKKLPERIRTLKNFRCFHSFIYFTFRNPS
jgi:hypothetical protein